MCCWKQHITRICEIQKIGPSNIFLIFVSLLRLALKHNLPQQDHLQFYINQLIDNSGAFDGVGDLINRANDSKLLEINISYYMF